MAAFAGSLFGLMAGGGLSWLVSRSSLVTGEACVLDTYDTDGVYYETDADGKCVPSTTCVPGYVSEDGVCKAYTPGGACGTPVENGTMTYDATGACVLTCDSGYKKDAAGTGCVVDQTVSHGSLTESDTENSWSVTWPEGIVKDSSNCALLTNAFGRGVCSDDFMTITEAGVLPEEQANIIMCGDTIVAALDDCTNPIVGDFAVNRSANKYTYWSENLTKNRAVIPEGAETRTTPDGRIMHYSGDQEKMHNDIVCDNSIEGAEMYLNLNEQSCSELFIYNENNTDKSCLDNKLLRGTEDTDQSGIKRCRLGYINIDKIGPEIRYPESFTGSVFDACNTLLADGRGTCNEDGTPLTINDSIDVLNSKILCGNRLIDAPQTADSSIDCEEDLYGLYVIGIADNAYEHGSDEDIFLQLSLGKEFIPFSRFYTIFDNMELDADKKSEVDNILRSYNTVEDQLNFTKFISMWNSDEFAEYKTYLIDNFLSLPSS